MSRSCVSSMPRIQALHHIHRLRSTDFAYDNPVRPHPQAGADQIPDRYLPAPFHVAVAGLHTNQIAQTLKLQLRAVLNRDNSLPGGNISRQHIEKGGLSTARTAADKNIVSGLNQQPQKLCHFPGYGFPADQLLHGNRGIGKATNSDDGTV